MSSIDITSTHKLKTNNEIPILGFGTAGDVADKYKINDEESLAANLVALKTGYRHLDSAQAYGSEPTCGQSVRQSGLDRRDVFVTSKVYRPGYEETKEAIDSGLKESGLKYFDLYLIHSPYGGPDARKGAWRAMVEAKKEGKILSMGVANYGVHHLNETEAYIKELETELGPGNGGEISVGQWELHPWMDRSDIVNWCRERNVVIEAYCPLVRGRHFDDPLLKPLTDKYKKTPAQILIRWSLQEGFVPLPKSITPARIESNADVFDFVLTSHEMSVLNTGKYEPCTWDPTVSPLNE